MAQPFKHDAACLLDFFSQSGRCFFVPYYQRNYSWDEENAAKLIEDIFSSIKRTLTNIQVLTSTFSSCAASLNQSPIVSVRMVAVPCSLT